MKLFATISKPGCRNSQSVQLSCFTTSMFASGISGCGNSGKSCRRSTRTTSNFHTRMALGYLQLNDASEAKEQKWLRLDRAEKDKLRTYFAALGARQVERFELKSELSMSRQEVSARDVQIADLRQHASNLDAIVADLRQHASSLDAALNATRALAASHEAVKEHLERTRSSAPGEHLRNGELRWSERTPQSRLALREEQLERLATKAARSQASVAQLFSLISVLRTQVETYERSRSWRVTAPLRAIRRGGRGVSLLSSLDVELSALRLAAASDDADPVLQRARESAVSEPATGGAGPTNFQTGSTPPPI